MKRSKVEIFTSRVVEFKRKKKLRINMDEFKDNNHKWNSKSTQNINFDFFKKKNLQGLLFFWPRVSYGPGP